MGSSVHVGRARKAKESRKLSAVPAKAAAAPANAGRGIEWQQVAAAALVLVAITLAVYWQTLGHEFISDYDDGAYVTDNEHVLAGLTRDSVAWAFAAMHSGNWHPLTWLSHMLDVQVYGLKPMGHHLTNLLFHLANVLLLFWVLMRMTGAVWKSAFVAALFAVHPLHVESVAWVAERKDVLSTFLWLLTTLAYAAYAQRAQWWRYVLVVVLFALGLMAKPMLVTLPITLLLLDYWPLSRFGKLGAAKLVLEKAPMLVLCAASSVVTLMAQRQGGAVETLERLPFGYRAENAVVSYAAYLVKMIWPRNLSVFYPHPTTRGLPAWEVVGSAALLVLISVLVIRGARRRPYLATGWLWYLLTLVPVIGLVQVGGQSMADRYTYVPLIGVLVMIAWGFPDLISAVARSSRTRAGGPAAAAAPLTATTLAVVAFAVIIALSYVAHTQVGQWRDSLTLFTHAIDVTSHNYVAYLRVGTLLKKQGDLDQAEDYLAEAVRLTPDNASAQINYGNVLLAKARFAEAAQHYRKALSLDPRDAKAHNNLGAALSRLNKLDEAEQHIRQAIHLDPEYADAYGNLGAVRYFQGRTDEALRNWLRAVRLKPDYADGHANLAVVYLNRGDYAEAWKEVRLCRKYGGKPPADLLASLSAAMAEPKK